MVVVVIVMELRVELLVLMTRDHREGDLHSWCRCDGGCNGSRLGF